MTKSIQVDKSSDKDEVVKDTKAIADKFNNFFINVGPTLAKKKYHNNVTQSTNIEKGTTLNYSFFIL